MPLFPFLNTPSRVKTAFNLFEVSWYAAALLIVTALGLANLYLPFGADTSVHILAAQSIDQGGTLYVDFWDNKPPGLYYFFYLAGRLFGFNEFGVHLFELIWLLLLSVCLMVTLRSVYSTRWLSALVPISSVGIYYATVAEDQLTQMEFLVSLPIYLSIWCAYIACRNRNKIVLLCFLSGLLAAVAVLFKLLLAPIMVMAWIILAGSQLYQRQLTFGQLLLKMVAPITLGVVLPIAAIVIWFARQNALPELLWTLFIYPSEALATAPDASKTRLVTTAAFFTSYFAPWLLFAAIALLAWFKSSKDQLMTLMLAWLATAIVIFLIQSFSWWTYHALLFFLPTAILAVAGIDRSLAYVNQHTPLDRHKTMLLSALIAIPLCASLTGPFLTKAQPLLSYTWVSSHKGIHEYRRIVSEDYKFLWNSTRFLSQPNAAPGPIYSFGRANIYTLANRQPAHKIPGTSWAFYTPEQLQDILETLEEKRVPYIFLNKDAYDKMPWKKPLITNFINANYTEMENHTDLTSEEEGIWFIHRKISADNNKPPVE